MLESIGNALFDKAGALLGCGAFFMLLEWKFAAIKNQKLFRKDFKLDVTYSFLLLLLFFPAQAVLAPFLTQYFYGTLALPPEQASGRVQVAIQEAPARGQALVLSDGTVQYRPDPGFSGLDAFVVKKSDGENWQTLTLLARVEAPAAVEGGQSPAAPQPQVALVVTSRVPGGKITQGFTGRVLQARGWILEQALLLQIFLAVFLIDFAGYWRHRLMHTRYLWPFHTIHHSSLQVDWLSTERFHPVNHYISASLNLVILTALFADLYVGATAMALRRAYGLFIHSNLPVSYGFLDKALVSPLFHRWHHSDGEIVEKKNYATFFSFFDLVFGTFYLPEEKKDPQSFGFSGGRLTGGFILQFVYPFRKLADLLWVRLRMASRRTLPEVVRSRPPFH